MAELIDLLKLSPTKRRPYFEKAASVTKLPIHIIEKDYWVCVALQCLFSGNLAEKLTFKGGTSLSKVYNIIERFSEDIDLTIDKSLLGIVDAALPENATSSNEQRRRIDKLKEKCVVYVQNDLKKYLEQALSQVTSSDAWDIQVDNDDIDGQTLLFHYPVTDVYPSEYIRPSIKIEIGARGEPWPTELLSVSSYASRALKDIVKPFDVPVQVLNVVRTFWEKATILHMLANQPAEKKIPPRHSRHYYDFHQLLIAGQHIEAVKNLDLLDRVSRHKAVYFRSSNAKYDQAKKGSIRLAPPEAISKELEYDYRKMQEMFFSDSPAWSDILTSIKSFEDEFNYSE